MLRRDRISPSLLLAICLAAALTAGAQEPTAPTPPTPPTPPPSQPMQQPAVPATAQPSPPESAVAPPPPPATPATPTGAPAQPPPATPAAPGRPLRPGQPAAPPRPPISPDLLQFQLKFPAAKGGGSASGAAASLEYKREDYAVLTGSVYVHYQDVDLQADQAEIDLSTKDVIALGNVVIDQGPRRMTGRSATFNLGTKTGKVKEATAFVSPDYFFSGTEIDKTGDSSYDVDNGIFTSCSQPVPDWSFRLGRAHVDLGGYARMHDVSMRAKKLPLLYAPYVLWPAKTERASGFLVPNIGYSQRRGVSLGLAYFQTLGRSYDTTFHLDLFQKSYLGVGDEFRYAPTAGTKGDFLGYMVRDSTLPAAPWRWKVEWNHVSNDLPLGMRGVINYVDFSDFNFFRDFERDFDRNTVRFLDNRATATGNWGPHLVNFLLERRETFTGVGNSVIDTRTLPGIDYHLRSTQIGKTPLYVELDGSADYFDLVQPTLKGRYGRVDLFPQLTVPVRSVPWLSLSLTGGERLTWYGDTLTPPATATTTPPPAGPSFDGKALTRVLPYGNAEIVGPSLSRIFDRDIGPFNKLKHVIEPRFTYTYQGTYDQAADIPQVDQVDTQPASNVGRIALDNRILAKPKDEKLGSAREVFLFEIARSYSFDAKQPLLGSVATTTSAGTPPPLSSQAGPLEALVRFEPSERASLKAEAVYDTLYKHLASTGLTASYGNPAGSYGGVTWFTQYETQAGTTLGDQVRLNGGFNLIPQRLRLEAQVNYDLQLHLLQQQRYIINWMAQCYGIRLELRDFRAGVRGTPGAVSDKEIRFSLSLKNVGTFLDLTSRSGTTAQQ